MQNFSSLALKLSEEFEVMDRRHYFPPGSLNDTHQAKMYNSKISKLLYPLRS